MEPNASQGVKRIKSSKSYYFDVSKPPKSNKRTRDKRA